MAQIKIDLSANTRQLTNQLNALQRQASGIKVNRLDTGFKNINRSAQNLNKTLRRTVGIVAAIAGAQQLGKLLETTDRIAKSAANLNIAASTYQRLGQAAANAGVNAEKLNVSIATFQRNVGAATRGSAEMASAIQRLGLNASRLQQSGVDAALLDTLRAVRDTENAFERADLAQRIFGEGGRELIGNIDEVIESLERRNSIAVIPDSALRSVENFNDSLSDLRFSFGNTLVTGLAPILDMFTRLFDNNVLTIEFATDLNLRINEFVTGIRVSFAKLQDYLQKNFNTSPEELAKEIGKVIGSLLVFNTVVNSLNALKGAVDLLTGPMKDIAGLVFPTYPEKQTVSLDTSKTLQVKVINTDAILVKINDKIEIDTNKKKDALRTAGSTAVGSSVGGVATATALRVNKGKTFAEQTPEFQAREGKNVKARLGPNASPEDVKQELDRRAKLGNFGRALDDIGLKITQILAPMGSLGKGLTKLLGPLGAVIAAFQAVPNAIEAFNKDGLMSAIGVFLGGVVGFFIEGIIALIDLVIDGVKALFTKDFYTGLMQAFISLVMSVSLGIEKFVVGVFDGLFAPLEDEFEALVSFSVSATNALAEFGEYLSELGTAIITPVIDAFVSLGDAMGSLKNGFLDFIDTVTGAFDGLGQKIVNGITDSLPDWLKKALGIDVQGFATGGSVYGQGTATSDDIPAMLSNGEFVVKTSVASKYRPFLEQLNSTGQMPSMFSQGGSAGSSRFSSGNTGRGTVGDLDVSNVQLALGIMEQIEGLATELAGLDVEENANLAGVYVDEMERLAGQLDDLTVKTETLTASLGEWFESLADGLGNSISRAIFSGGSIGKAITQTILQEAQSSLADGLSALFKDLVKQLGGMMGGGGGMDWAKLGTAFIGAFATGGQIKGPGTGTSDSILARVSNGEYVVNAKSTKKYGPLIEAINNGTFETPAFADGGLVGDSLKGQSLVAKEMAQKDAQGSRAQTQVHQELHITGDISRQTKREILGMMPTIANGVTQYNNEQGR